MKYVAYNMYSVNASFFPGLLILIYVCDYLLLPLLNTARLSTTLYQYTS